LVAPEHASNVTLDSAFRGSNSFWKPGVVLLAGLGLALNVSSLNAQDTLGSGDVEGEIYDLKEFVVDGIQMNLLKAEYEKREAIQVVDVINAEDIGKFPDQSLSEALQRISGVQISRDRGEATQVLIRGLPDLATTLNGDDVFTGNGRRLALQDLPVQTLASVQVYKSATPDQLEGGIAGLVNARLRAPFDFEDKTASAYADFRLNDPNGNGTKSWWDSNLGFLYSDRWQTKAGEFGLLVDAVSISDEYNNPVQWNDVPDRVWAVDANGNGRRLDDSERNADGTYIAPEGTRLGSLPAVGGVYSAGWRQRPVMHSAMQLKVDDTLQFDAQLLYMGFRSEWENDFIFSVTQWAPVGTNITLAPEGEYSDTIFGNVSPVLTATLPPIANGIDPYTATSTQAHDSRTDSFYGSLAMNKVFDKLTWNSRISFVSSKYEDDRIIVDQNILYPTASIYTNDADGHGGFSITTPTSSAPLKDANEFVLRGFFQSFDVSEGKQFAWNNDFSYETDRISWLEAIQGGVRVSMHNAVNHSADGGVDVPDPSNRPSPVEAFGTDFDKLVSGIDRLGGSFMTPSIDFLLDRRDEVRNWYGVASGRMPENPNRLFNQDENTYAGYLQGKYGFKVGELYFSGLVGGRLLQTERTLKGKNVIGGVVEDFNLESSETSFLPSVSTIVDITDQLQLRVNVGKTMTRPGFAALNPSLSLTPPTVNREGYGGAGNPDLKPVESISTDVTLEYYFSTNGYMQLSLFHRDVEGYVQSFGQYEMVNGVEYNITRPNNSGKGKLQGYELAIQKFFNFLPEPFNDFGIQANYTYIDGENETSTELNGSEFIKTDLAGVATHNYNIALMYEAHRITARLALTHRGDYAEALKTGRFQLDNRVQASDYIDLSIGYQLNKNISLQFNALNLTGEHYESYQGDVMRGRDIRYGTSEYLFGIRWKL